METIGIWSLVVVLVALGSSPTSARKYNVYQAKVAWLLVGFRANQFLRLTRMAFLQGIASLKKTYLLKIQNLLLGISLIQGELTYLFFTVTFIKITSLKLTLR